MIESDTEIARTPDDERIEALLTDVYDHELPPVLADLVADYQDVPGARPPFMWKWVHRLAPANTLPCVRAEFEEKVPVDKTIAILFVTLLDDVLEKRRDRATFRAAATVPFEGRAVEPTGDADADYVAFVERVWNVLDDRLRRAPEYDAYAELLRRDVRQAIDAIEYSDFVIRSPGLATMTDMRRIESHNMAMLAYADIDLMHARRANRADLPVLREAVRTAQLMARIGNWVSTWERELREGDYSNGVVVYALENGVIEGSDLREAEYESETEPKSETGGEDRLDRIAEQIRERGIEDHFLDKWEEHRDRLREFDARLSTMDLAPFVEGTETVLRYHLATTGLK